MRLKHWFYTIPLSLQSLLRRSQVEQELDEELHYHIDRQIEELIAKGMTEEEARYAALLARGLQRQQEYAMRCALGAGRIALFRQVSTLPFAVEIEWRPPAGAPSDLPVFPQRAITEGYFKLLGQRLVAGRDFRSTDNSDAPRVAIVNQAFADRYFPEADPIGKKLWNFGRKDPPWEIIGVATNGRTEDLTKPAEPEIYTSQWQFLALTKHLLVRTQADPRAMMPGVQRELRAIDPTVSIENLKTLEEIRDESQAARSFAMRLLIGFSIVASVLTLVGIYGVLSLSVAARRRELAIRTAMGAERRDLLKLVLGEGLRLIALGVAVGLAAAIVLSRVLRSFLFEVAPTDPITLVVVGLLFVVVALLACWAPARRAAKVDPLEALRYE